MQELAVQHPVFFSGVIFALGLIVGSFLNVCIHRMPRGESIVSPGSHCPACSKAVAWHDNIPLLSYAALGGKCRYCKIRISPRYCLTELICGLMWFGLFWFYGFSAFFLAAVFLFTVLLAVTVTDFETGLIPDELSFSGIVLGLAVSAWAPEIHGKTVWYEGLLASALGLLAGGGILYGMAWIGDRIFKKDSMGGGDVKLLAMIGTFLGIKNTIFVFFMAPFPALPFGLYMKYIKKSETIPFGPFLAAAAAVFFIWGDLITAYFGF